MEAVLIFPGTVIPFEMRVLGDETLLIGLLVELAFVLTVEHFPFRQWCLSGYFGLERLQNQRRRVIPLAAEVARRERLGSSSLLKPSIYLEISTSRNRHVKHTKPDFTDCGGQKSILLSGFLSGLFRVFS
jgi:hypothetical protein